MKEQMVEYNLALKKAQTLQNLSSQTI